MKDIENMSQVEIRDSLVKDFQWDLIRMAKAKGTTQQDMARLLKYGGNDWRRKYGLPPVPRKENKNPVPTKTAPVQNKASLPSDMEQRIKAIDYISGWCTGLPGTGPFVEREMERYPDDNFTGGTTIVRFVLYDKQTGELSFEMRDTSQPMTRKYLKNLPVVKAEQLTTQSLVLIAAILKSRR